MFYVAGKIPAETLHRIWISKHDTNAKRACFSEPCCSVFNSITSNDNRSSQKRLTYAKSGSWAVYFIPIALFDA
ncbi:hypothetical protein Brsp01_09780 [Brucella sp. NBRC 12950]|nr:hypothetical protein Brsp01_09780 [Brucella sp. NBRC 12950]